MPKPYEITPLLFQWGTMRGAFDHADFHCVMPVHTLIDDNYDGIEEKDFWMLYGECRFLARAGVKTCMVCQAGENRSGMASVMYLHAGGMKLEEAIALVREKVPTLTDNPHVLWNPGFLRQLREHLK